MPSSLPWIAESTASQGTAHEHINQKRQPAAHSDLQEADPAHSSKGTSSSSTVWLDASCTVLSQQASKSSCQHKPTSRLPEQQLGYRTVAVSFNDSTLPAALCPLVKVRASGSSTLQDCADEQTSRAGPSFLT